MVPPERARALSLALGAMGLLLAGVTALRAAAAGPEPSAELSGRILIVGTDGREGPAEGAVAWVPGVNAPRSSTASLSGVASRDKRFDPHVLAVQPGTVVPFPNLDKIHHNVFSRTPGSAFDLGLYRNGASKTARFDSPGLVRIYCNIHAQMAAYILVVDGTSAVVDGSGAFRLPGLPPGRHEVRVWHERSGETRAAVDLVPGRAATLTLTLDGSRHREQGHKNKHGEDYPPPERDADRY